MNTRPYRALRTCLALFAVGSLAFTACSVDVPDPTDSTSGATSKKKGGGSKGASAASSAGQKGGSNATSAQDSATSQGPESDGLVCDGTTEGVGWCSDDASIVFCSDESWWLLDCTQYDPEAFCAYDDDLNIVDCYVLVDDEDGDDECLDLDEACADDADCCSGFCDEEGFCDDGEDGEDCLDADVDCADDAECCSGFCDEEGFCG